MSHMYNIIFRTQHITQSLGVDSIRRVIFKITVVSFENHVKISGRNFEILNSERDGRYDYCCPVTGKWSFILPPY
jgi:hypothetical protein